MIQELAIVTLFNQTRLKLGENLCILKATYIRSGIIRRSDSSRLRWTWFVSCINDHESGYRDHTHRRESASSSDTIFIPHEDWDGAFMGKELIKINGLNEYTR